MASIKLFSGMDFSGKTTIIRQLDEIMPRVFNISSKFITPINTLQNMIEQDIWIPKDRFLPLLKRLVKKDLLDYTGGSFVLQDTLWVIKFTARLIAENNDIYRQQINELMELISQYPQMDSFYVTTTIEERINRYYLRKSSGKRVSRSDKLIFNKDAFEEVEKWYRYILFKKFPDTCIIDTTLESPATIVEKLREKYFGDV